jgi:hypothetical protein
MPNREVEIEGWGIPLTLASHNIPPHFFFPLQADLTSRKKVVFEI